MLLNTNSSTLLSRYLQQVVLEFWLLLYEQAMFLEEGAEKECQVLDKVLLILLSILVGITNVGAQRQHLERETTTIIALSMLSNIAD